MNNEQMIAESGQIKKQLNVLLSPELIEGLRIQRVKQGRPVNHILEDALTMFLNKREPCAIEQPSIECVLTMSSREIADLTEKQHQHVKRDIEGMLHELGEDASNFGHIYIDSMNRQQTEYSLSRELTETLLTGYSAKLRLAVIRRWTELEAQVAKPVSTDLSRMDILQIAMQAEQERLVAIEQRDEAIRTKAQIGSKREATAMATAAKAVREAESLREQLGFNTKHATVTAVENKLDWTFGKQDWRLLKAWCKENQATPETVACPRFGSVKSWPAGAWMAVFSIDLVLLFGEGA